MRFFGCFPTVAFLLVACGGQSTGAGGNARSDAGAPSGGAGVAGTHSGAGGNTGTAGGTSGTAGAGSSTGGADGGAASIDLGDGDHGDDGPMVPDGSPGGFFWGGCNGGWRLGNWFLTSDTLRDVGLSEIVPPRDGSTAARRVSGASFPAGVVLWVQLDHPENRAVSLSGCSGIGFWARLESKTGRLVVALNDGSRGSGSLDSRSTLPSRTLAIGPDWQAFTLHFESFPLDDVSVASIEFFVGDGGESFDLWVDDLALLCASECP